MPRFSVHDPKGNVIFVTWPRELWSDVMVLVEHRRKPGDLWRARENSPVFIEGCRSLVVVPMYGFIWIHLNFLPSSLLFICYGEQVPQLISGLGSTFGIPFRFRWTALWLRCGHTALELCSTGTVASIDRFCAVCCIFPRKSRAIDGPGKII